MRNPPKLDQASLNNKFEYGEGSLYRKTTVARGSPVGTKLGVIVSIGYHNYSLARVIYTMHHGVEPDHIDHIDGDLTNNHIENLTSVTKEQYDANVAKHKYYHPNDPQVKRVRNNIYIARVGSKCIGEFASPMSAVTALKEYKENR